MNTFVCELLTSTRSRKRFTSKTIYIQTDLPGPNYFSGKYWELVKKEPNLWTRIKIVKCELPSEIFGQQLSDGWRLFHGSDVARIRYIWRWGYTLNKSVEILYQIKLIIEILTFFLNRVIMQYGGIYLDNDVFVIQSLDKYRKFEIAMNWDENQFLGNQVSIKDVWTNRSISNCKICL